MGAYSSFLSLFTLLPFPKIVAEVIIYPGGWGEDADS